MSDQNPEPTAPQPQPARVSPAHNGRRVAAAVSAGAFTGIALGLVLTHGAGASASNDQPVAPVAATSSQQGTGTDPAGGNGFGPSDGSATSPDQGQTFGQAPSAATPSFGVQTAPNTNSGGS